MAEELLIESTLGDNKDNLEITSFKFSEDHKTLTVDMRFVSDIFDIDKFNIYSTDFRVEETWPSGRVLPDRYQPDVTSVISLNANLIDSLDMELLMLVDLTLPQKLIDAERRAAILMYSSFNDVYISFLKGDGTITSTTPLTDEILENDFVEEEYAEKHLYHGINEKFSEIAADDSTSRTTLVMVMTDGAVWGMNGPYDPNHFEEQQTLLNSITDPRLDNCMLFATAFNEDEEDEQEGLQMLQHVCEKTSGIYQSHFDWIEFFNKCMIHMNRSVDDIRVILTLKDGRVFDGDPHVLTLKLYSENTLEATAQKVYWEGSVFNPYVVNGKSVTVIILGGIILGLLIMLLTYLLLQIVEPYIRYRFFQRKYVKEYTGTGMCVEGRMVADTCYLCKAPFEIGEKIVAKCDHTMHLDCWNENEYHCPEHGVHCPDGSHYYNRRNLFDPSNALFYCGWILLAIVAAMLSWLDFYQEDVAVEVLVRMYCSLNGIDFTQIDSLPEAHADIERFYQLPFFAVSIGFFLIGLLGIKTVPHYPVLRRWTEIIGRAILASAWGLLVFFFVGITEIVLDSNFTWWMFAWIPWVLVVIGFLVIQTSFTRIKVNYKQWILCILFSVVLTIAWNIYVTYSEDDYRIAVLVGYMLFCVSYAVGIAFVSPRSSHYFLKVEGAIKTMDIALYKWFRAQPYAHVTIGKAVDCNLQMSWDIMGDIAPVQASITMRRGRPFLKAEEDGITLKDGKSLPAGRSVRLWHGTSFTIGTTTFTYLEKD